MAKKNRWHDASGYGATLLGALLVGTAAYLGGEGGKELSGSVRSVAIVACTLIGLVLTFGVGRTLLRERDA